jgi:hypothetical protein
MVEQAVKVVKAVWAVQEGPAETLAVGVVWGLGLGGCCTLLSTE